MIAWSRIDALGVVRAYLADVGRRAAPPSLAGFDPDMPRCETPGPPNGDREQLYWLLRALPPLAHNGLVLRVLGTAGARYRPCVTGSPDGHVSVTWEQEASPLDWAAVGAILGCPASDARAAVNAALQLITERLAEVRRIAKEDP